MTGVTGGTAGMIGVTGGTALAGRTDVKGATGVTDVIRKTDAGQTCALDVIVLLGSI